MYTPNSKQMVKQSPSLLSTRLNDHIQKQEKKIITIEINIIKTKSWGIREEGKGQSMNCYVSLHALGGEKNWLPLQYPFLFSSLLSNRVIDMFIKGEKIQNEQKKHHNNFPNFLTFFSDGDS